MRMTIFGATGTIGVQLTEQALASGHEVVAFTRDRTKLGIHSPNLRLVEGDVLRPNDAMHEAIRGSSAVMVVLGNGIRGGLRHQGTTNIIDVMKREGVNRLICQSTLGAGQSFEQCNWLWKLIFRFPLRHVLADHNKQEGAVRGSGLDWTIVRPAAFTDGSRTGEYLALPEQSSRRLKLKISRADVADFMLRLLANEHSHHQSLSLSY